MNDRRITNKIIWLHPICEDCRLEKKIELEVIKADKETGIIYYAKCEHEAFCNYILSLIPKGETNESR